jgi:hypothetical protein
MNNKKEQQSQQPCFKDLRNECDKVYVSWLWLVGILVVMAATFVGAGMNYSKEQEIQNSNIKAIGVKTEAIYTNLEQIKENSNKLDTILARLR